MKEESGKTFFVKRLFPEPFSKNFLPYLTWRKLHQLGEKIDAVMAYLPEKELDFFKSQRMKAHLTNTGYIEVLSAKVDRIKEAIPDLRTPQNKENR